MTAKTCRLCLNENGEFYGLFDLANSESLRIVDEINHLLNIRIYEDDRLPRSICSNCYKILDFFKEFRLTCLKVNNFLLEQVEIWSQLDEERFLEVMKSGRKCTTPSPKDIKTSQFSTENVEKTSKSIGKADESLDASFLDFLSNSRTGSYNKTKMQNIVYCINNLNKDFGDMPPLISLDALQTKKSQLTKQDLQEKNSASRYHENSPIVPEIEEPNMEKILLDANIFENSSLWNNKEKVFEDSSKGVDSDLATKEPFHAVQENISPSTLQEARDLLSARKDGEVREHLDSCSSTNFTEHLPKNEEVILSESECDTEIPNDIGEDIGNSLLQEQDESNAEVISILSSDTSDCELNDFVIELPDKIRKYETDFNKAILDVLLSKQNNGIKLSNTVVKETAKKIARDRGNKKFMASNGWLISFFKRFNIEPHIDEITITTNNLQARTLSNRFIIRYCCDEVNEHTYNTCESILSSGAQLSAKLIQNIASKIALEEGISEFIATTGWLNSFRRKYVVNLRGRKTPMMHFQSL